MTERQPDRSPTGGGGEVVPLGRDPAPAPAPIHPPRALHAIATSGMAAFALVGIIAMLAFITVRWPDTTGRYVVAVIIAAALGFMSCAVLAVFSAARDTYPRRTASEDENEDRAD